VTHRATRGTAIIVGAGIVGAACAEALTRDGWRVLVLERGFLGGGATAAAMGHLVVMDDSPAQLALTAYSVRLWQAVRESLPSEVEWLSSGTLWIAEDAEQLDSARAKCAVYRDAGIAADIVNGHTLGHLEPNLRPGLAGALHVPHDAVIYPPAAARWLLEKARSDGAEVREGIAVTAVTSGAVQISGGELRADLVLLAAGAHTAELIPELPIVPRRGHLVVTDRYPGFCTHQLVELGYLASAHALDAPSVAFNVQPRVTGQLLVGSSRELVGWDSATNRDVVRQMLDRAVRFMPNVANLNALRVWTGFRPATPEGLPLIGPWPSMDGVWIAAGHEGLGITTSLATAQFIADLVAGRTPAIDPLPYAPHSRSVVHGRTGAHA
jgi:glycine/D-amino acid oxidase-like deaminating enzyme